MTSLPVCFLVNETSVAVTIIKVFRKINRHLAANDLWHKNKITVLPIGRHTSNHFSTQVRKWLVVNDSTTFGVHVCVGRHGCGCNMCRCMVVAAFAYMSLYNRACMCVLVWHWAVWCIFTLAPTQKHLYCVPSGSQTESGRLAALWEREKEEKKEKREWINK